MSVPPAPTVRLHSGATMPRLGLGTWPMDDAEAERAVAQAVELGYRLVDTAYAYGNETGVGRGLRASGVPREELFVTTKFNAASHGVREAQEAFEAAAGRLGLEYLDLLLIHWPNPAQDRYVEAFEGLIELHEAGRVRALGTSNFKPAHLERVREATGRSPDVNEIELDPTLTRTGPRGYHETHGIVTESYSPLGHGSALLEHPAVRRLAGRHGRTPAQVVLRWHMELDLVTIPKSSDPTRMRENLEVFDFTLEPEEVAELSALDRGEEAATDSDRTGH